MKILSILTVSFTLIACQPSSTPVETTLPETENWSIFNRTASTHTYTPQGLLDKTYKTNFVYELGLLVDSVKSVTLRQYDDRQNLINEKEATIKKDNTTIPSSEDVYKYDSKNNLIEQASYFEGKLVKRRKHVYDSQNKNIQTILVYSLTNPYLLENAKQKLVYDTTYQENELDEQGNVVKITASDKKGNLKYTVFKTYHQGRCVASHRVNAAGQTTSRSEVTKDGKMDKETTYLEELSNVNIIWRENGKVIKSLIPNANPVLRSRSEYKYNEKGDEAEVITYK